MHPESAASDSSKIDKVFIHNVNEENVHLKTRTLFLCGPF